MVYTHSVSAPVPGTISHMQLWKGLRHKARDPALFIPVIQECYVTSEDKAQNTFVRYILFKGAEKGAFETVHELFPSQIRFSMEQNPVMVENTISTDVSKTSSPGTLESDLILTFTFHWESGETPGSEAEFEKMKGITAGTKNAVLGTLAQIEKLVEEGKL